MEPLTVGEIAHVCHEANRALQKITGDPVPSPRWEHAPKDQRESSRSGVVKALDGATPEQLHAEWCRFKHEDGWVWGPTKDPVNKTHPCMVPYADLPPEQKLKDALFTAIVRALSGAPAAEADDDPLTVAGLSGLLEQAADALNAALGGEEPSSTGRRGHLSGPLRTGLVASIQLLAHQRNTARSAGEVADARIESLVNQLNALRNRDDKLTRDLKAAQARIAELEGNLS